MSASETRACPICEIAGAQLQFTGNWHVECPRCGRYVLTGSEAALIGRVELSKRMRLSAWLRERAEVGGSPATIGDGWQDKLQDVFRDLTVPERGHKLLAWLARKTTHPGVSVDLFPDHDCVVAGAQNSAELNFYLESLYERDWARRDNPGMRTSGSPWKVQVRPRGWEYLDQHGGAGASSLVFVARRFAPDEDALYRDAITPAIESVGWRPYSVQDDRHGERIDAYVMVKIREARFLVADMTGIRPNVLYEAGYAQGIGKEVIWTAPQSVLDAKDLPFDTRQFRHVPYENPDELHRGLAAEIEFRIGKGPLTDERQATA